MEVQDKIYGSKQVGREVAENKKNINVAVPPELHARVKSAAALRGTNVEGAYRQALEEWIGPGRAERDPLAELTHKDRETVVLVIEMLRHRTLLAETVRVITRKYEWDKKHGVPEP